jgi:hypothetical protein
MTDPAVIGARIADRMRDVATVLERRDSFVSVLVETSDPETVDESDDTDRGAEEFVLRALRAVADPINHRLLTRLDTGDTTLSDLGHHVGMARIAVWERVSDLVQCGLVGHSIDHDAIGLSAAGQELLAWVTALTSATASHVEPGPAS